MAFSTPLFLFLLLPILLLIYGFIVPDRRTRFLLLCSFFLYLWSEGRNTWILLLTVLVTYVSYCAIEKIKGAKLRAWVLGLGISGNLLLLLVFKYATFFITSVNPVLRGLGLETLSVPRLPLPLGISFSTFLAISLQIDVYRKTAGPTPSFVSSALYITFFPTILAGPITPFRELAPQLQETDGRILRIHSGVLRLIVGLGKKVLLADILGRVAGPIFSIPAEELTLPLSWIGLVAYTLQIYFDFSGYSDMAIGIGQILGFRFPENFNYPYAATSIADFWSRWHQSLTRWLRDYLFLPIAYQVLKRIPQERWLGIKAESWSYGIGMFLTMILCGFWHGASWTFILWGAYHGVLILLERFAWGKRLKKKPMVVRRIYALSLVSFGWLLFRSASLEHFFAFLKAMFGGNGVHSLIYYPALYLKNDTLFAFVVAIFAAFPLVPRISRLATAMKEKAGENRQRVASKAAIVLQLLSLTAILVFAYLYIANETYQPFIYFRF